MSEATETTQAPQATPGATETAPTTVMPESTPSADAANEAQMDSALDRILGIEPQAGDKTVGDKADDGKATDNGAEAAKPEANADDGAEADEAKAQDKPTDDNAGDVKATDLQAAISVLKRDNVPAKVIGQLTPEEIMAWAGKRQKVQSHVDTVTQKSVTLEQQIKQIEEERERLAAEQATKPDAGDEAAVQDDGGLAFPKVVQDAFSTIENDELYADMAKPIKTIVGHLVSRVQQAEQALANGATNDSGAMVNFLTQRLEQMEISSAKASLSDRFPQLADSQQFSKVHEEMRRMAGARDETGAPLYGDMGELMNAAALHVFADDIIKSSTKQRQILNDQRSKGTLSVDSRRDKSTPRTAQEAEDAALDAIMAGKGRDEASKVYRSYLSPTG